LIKIRYADLPAGLHVRAEVRGRSTVIYLLPGLTPAQRRAALVRARRNASMGHGPQLPTARFVAAVLADHLTATLRNGATAFRAHPLLLLPPVIIAVTATFVYIMLAAVTITIRPPQGDGSYPQPGTVLPAPRHPRPGQPGVPGRIGDQAGPGPAGTPRPGGPASPRPSRSPGRSATVTPSASASGSGSRSARPTASPRPSAPTPGPPGSGTPSPPSSTSPTPSPSPSPTGKCVHIGPLGLCLKL
jgi:hypothetical protein